MGKQVNLKKKKKRLGNERGKEIGLGNPIR